MQKTTHILHETIKNPALTSIQVHLHQEIILLRNTEHSLPPHMHHSRKSLPIEQFFKTTQIFEAQPFAPSAWASSSTMSANASLSFSGMVPKPDVIKMSMA